MSKPAPIDLYYWTTPNGHKITIFLEETGLPYTIRPVNITRNEQQAADFLAISPNGRIPAIVDPAPASGQGPQSQSAQSLFESGAILLYLAEKTGQFIPAEGPGRCEVLQWLFWQMGGLGPTAGQNHHFVQFAPERLPYPTERFVKETHRLYGVLDRRLADRPFVAGDYSIADMAIFPWIVPWKRQLQVLSETPNLRRWFDAVRQRPAVRRAWEQALAINDQPRIRDDLRMIVDGAGGG